MSLSTRFSNNHIPAFSRNSTWFMGWGIALIILGALAIGASTFTTLATVVFLGFLIFIGGIIALIDALTYWRKGFGNFLLHLIAALLYLLVGFMFMYHPILGSISITLVLGILYLIVGVFRITFASTSFMPNWGWSFASGVIAVILGILILAGWPGTSLFVIGLFIGIDLLFLGFSYVMFALAARNMSVRIP